MGGWCFPDDFLEVEKRGGGHDRGKRGFLVILIFEASLRKNIDTIDRGRGF